MRSITGGRVSPEQFERIVARCDRYELAWRSGHRPRIEDHLNDAFGVGRALLFRELLGLELELRSRGGERPDLEEYLTRFPDWPDLVDEVFRESKGERDAPDSGGRQVSTEYWRGSATGDRVRVESAPLPTTIGKYLVVALLDEGGQGEVFRVVHPGLGKELVLKLSRQSVDPESITHDLMVAEGRLLAGLDHPGLVRILDLDFHEGRPFLVMEYIAGCNLQQHTEQRRMTPRQAAAFVADLAKVVGMLHRRGVTHLDIKPKNILIDDSGQVRLIDFGLARLRHAWSDEPAAVSGGTLSYMAPEQARGETDRIGPACDIFALGGVLYYLITGKAPFSGKNAADVWVRAKHNDFDAALLHSSRVSPVLTRVCLKALATEPADRHASAEELAASLERFHRRWRRRVLQASVVGVLSLLAWATIRPGPNGVGEATTSRPQAPQDMIQVRRGGLLYDNLREILPLRTGDLLRIRCNIPRGLRPAVYWRDSDGRLMELKPEFLNGDRTDFLAYPAPNRVVPLTGPAGTELLLICAGRNGQPVNRSDLEASMGGSQSWPALPDRMMIRVDGDGVRSEFVPESTREESASEFRSGRGEVSRGLGPPASDVPGRVEQQLLQLHRALNNRVEFLEGVAVPHAEAPQPQGTKSEPPASHLPR